MRFRIASGALVILLACAGWPGRAHPAPPGTASALRRVDVTEYRLKQDLIEKVTRGASLALVHKPESYEELGGKGRKFSRWLATDRVTIAADPEKHLAFGGAAQLRGGDLVVVYREGTKHAEEPSGRICLSRSQDGGRTWLPRVVVWDRPQEDDRGGGVFHMSDGTLVLNCASGGMRVSLDQGQTWSEIRRTNVASPMCPVEDEQGHIVYGGQAMVQKDFAEIDGQPAHLLACAVERSRDKGLSWERVGVPTYTLQMKDKVERSVLWQREPSLCVVANKFWIMCTCCRMVGDGFLRIIRSGDRGKTWGPVIKTPVWGKPGHLLALRDGRVLLTYGYRRIPYGVRACLSRDYGLTWDMDQEIILRMDGGTPVGQPRRVADMDLGYAQSIQLQDGRIFTAYYFNKDGSNAYMAGTFWELPMK